MKTQKIYLILALVGMASWSCTTQNDMASGSLASSLDNSAQKLSTAMNEITTSTGYQVLETSDASTSSSSSAVKTSFVIDSTYNSITLNDITGIYDYKAVSYKKGGVSILKYFTNAGTSDHMIVRLPESKVKNPRVLFSYVASDSLLTNNYVIDLSKYQYNYNRYLGWDYDMASAISVSDVSAGNLAIQSSYNKTNGYSFAAAFTFANGYETKTSYTTGDTVRSSYTISKANAILYSEDFTAVKSSTTKRYTEKAYTLTIGDVKIVRGSGVGSLDSAKVYLAGVLQTNATVEVVDIATTTDDTATCLTNHKRDLKITFDDGTSTTISTLIGSSIDDIRTLFVSLRQVYFATSVVDKIAWSIYNNK